MSSKLNVHYYDTHWVINNYMKNMCCHALDRKLSFIDDLKKRLSSISPLAQSNFNTIASENVYDPSNNIHVFDLLYIIEDVCRKYEDCSDIIKALTEQLEDMSTGMCPQGRTTRLYQIIYSFMEDTFE